MRKNLILIVTVMLLTACGVTSEDTIIDNFEKSSGTIWQATGNAFNKCSSLEGEGDETIKGAVGEYYLGSKPELTGKTRTLEFPVNHDYLNFLIGGGKDKDSLCFNILVDGQVVASRTGDNKKQFKKETVDLSAYKGKNAVVEIVDLTENEKWGYIAIDDIVLTNNPYYATRELTFTANKRYLVFPVTENDKLQRVNINIDGEYYDNARISLADSDNPSFFVFIDLGAYQGKEITVEMPKLKNEQFASLKNIKIVDEVPGSDSLYSEEYRPRFHYTSQRGWLSDPNGLVYYNGEYHLFHQHNPYGYYCMYNIGWGHATSKDLIHWEQKPEALRPNKFMDDAWSGSAVVDKNNTAGFKSGDQSPIVLIYTGVQRGECLAYSTDGGKTFQNYEGNPVLKGATADRDPKVSWYEPGQHWVMARHITRKKDGRNYGYMGFYTSPNLKDWTFQSKIPASHSCPELFELQIDGENEKKWIEHDMFGHYRIGDFDGKVFAPITKEKNTYQYGKDIIKGNVYNHGSAYVAAQRFNNTPDGRIIHTAFTYNGVMPHGSSFNNCMLFPVEQRLRRTKNFGLRMCPKPIDEISMLHDKTFSTSAKSVNEFNKEVAGVSGFEDVLHVKLKLENVKSKVEFKINGATITIDNDTLYCYGNLQTPFPKVKRTAIDSQGRVKGPLFVDNGEVELEILLDKTTMEIFGNDGELFMPIGLYFYPDFDAMLFGRPLNKLEIKSFMDVSKRGFSLTTNNDAIVKRFEVYTMKSIWEKK